MYQVMRMSGKAKEVFGILSQLAKQRGNKSLGDLVEGINEKGTYTPKSKGTYNL